MTDDWFNADLRFFGGFLITFGIASGLFFALDAWVGPKIAITAAVVFAGLVTYSAGIEMDGDGP